jgi:hypothetical protein
MRLLLTITLVLLLGACRGEPVPRDYQNHPPTMTDPPKTASETPSGHGIGKAAPEPTSGVEGTSGPYQPVEPTTPTTTVADTPPATRT